MTESVFDGAKLRTFSDKKKFFSENLQIKNGRKVSQNGKLFTMTRRNLLRNNDIITLRKTIYSSEPANKKFHAPASLLISGQQPNVLFKVRLSAAVIQINCGRTSAGGSSANLLDEYVGIVQTYPLDLQAHPLPSEALAYPVILNLIQDPVVCRNVAKGGCFHSGPGSSSG